MKYSYPAIFTRERDGKYDVFFPDLDGCYTCGDDLADALKMAADVLAFTLSDYEKEGSVIPQPSVSNRTVDAELGVSDSFVRMVACDTKVYYPHQAVEEKNLRMAVQ